MKGWGEMGRFDLCFRLWDTCKTICEGIEYCEKHTNTTRVSRDVVEGLRAVEPYFKSRLGNLSKKFSANKLYAKSFLAAAAAEIIAKLNEQMRECAYIEAEDAEQMFLMWEEFPHEDRISYQWIFDVCIKSAASLPACSFQYMMMLMEEQPAILSGKEAPHPGYVYRPSEQHEFKNCPICNGCGTPYFCAFSYQMSNFEYPHLPVKLWMKCEVCGNLYTWQYPKALLELSNHAEIVYLRADQRLTSIENTSSLILAIWSDILHELQAYSGGNTLLEVGVGKGELLAVAQEMGFEADGVEIMAESAQKVADMLGMPIWCGDFLHYKPNKQYSILIMGDVLEHITDPERALRNAHHLLEDNGVLWLSTPNFESSFSKLRKFYDAMWMEPYHIAYFSRKGLEALASKSGFSVKTYGVSRRYNGSMELILTKKRRDDYAT